MSEYPIGRVLLATTDDPRLQDGVWLQTDGSWVDLQEYSKLFSVIGHRHGRGKTDGEGRFQLPTLNVSDKVKGWIKASD